MEPKRYYVDPEKGCPYYKKEMIDSEPKNDAGREPDLICWFKGPVCKRPYYVKPKEVCKHCPASYHITSGFTDVSDSSLKKFHEFANTVYEVLQDVARAKDLSRTEYGGINMQTDNKNKESVSFDDLLKSVDDFMEVLFGPYCEEADDEPKNEVDQEAKADAGKAQLSLVPQAIIYDIARIREYGNAKYPEGGKDNWKSVSKERYVDAMLRHISAYISDPDGVDKESGFPHLWHAACNMAFILEMEDE